MSDLRNNPNFKVGAYLKTNCQAYGNLLIRVTSLNGNNIDQFSAYILNVEHSTILVEKGLVYAEWNYGYCGWKFNEAAETPLWKLLNE